MQSGGGGGFQYPLNAGFVRPAPAMFGNFSVLLCTQAVLFLHLIICLVSIFLPSNEIVHWGKNDFDFTHRYQSIMAGWFLFGVPCIIFAGVGAIYRIESHLTYYLGYSYASLAIELSSFLLLTKQSSVCETLKPAFGEEAQAYFVCGIADGFVLFWMCGAVALQAFSIYIVWAMRDYIRSRTEAELIRYKEPWMQTAVAADSLAQEQARALREVEKVLSIPQESVVLMPNMAQMSDGYGGMGYGGPMGGPMMYNDGF